MPRTQRDANGALQREREDLRAFAQEVECAKRDAEVGAGRVAGG
jgi:hypothetical protein